MTKMMHSLIFKLKQNVKLKIVKLVAQVQYMKLIVKLAASSIYDELIVKLVAHILYCSA